MASTSVDHVSLTATAGKDLINEAVMQQIWDISRIPLPFTDIAGTDTHGREYYEWTQDALSSPSLTNKLIDGADAPTYTAVIGSRVGNHSQISGKQVRVSTRARESDTIGYADRLSYDIMMRQQELRRDVEAGCLSNLASIAGTDTAAGQSGGLQSWLETNSSYASDGTAGAFVVATGLTKAAINGTAEALTEDKIRDVAESCYENGGSPTILMMVPTVCRKVSEYLFTSSARIATLTAETGQSEGGATAKGSVNVFVTDFGVVLELTPNRIQQNYTTAESAAFLIDPGHVRVSFLHGYRVEPLAKTGLSDNRLLAVDWTLVVTTEKAHGVIGSIDNTAAVTA